MGATGSKISPSSNNITDEKLKPNIIFSWLHIPSNKNECIPTHILTQQEQVRSFIRNIELRIFNDEIELDAYIREMPLMNKAILIVNSIAAIDAVRRVHQEWNDYSKVKCITLEQILP
jgi:hypothetical protein